MASWFQSVLNSATKLVLKEGEDFVLQPLSTMNGAPKTGDLVKDQDYVTIRVMSSRIVNVRKGFTKFYGSVQSRVSYLHRDRGLVEYQRVIAPEMRELDADNVDRVITINKPVLGPVPYIGDLSLELGLFSVRSSDLAAPYLDLLNSIADKSGVAFLGAAMPYVEPLRKGADLLFGNAKQSTLEIGLDKTWSTLSTGAWLLMRAPKDKVEIDKLKLDMNDWKITTNDGTPYKRYPYIIFQIEASRRRDDWMMIPELKSAWDAIAEAVRGRRIDDAEQLLKQFELIAQWSADLVPEDSRLLIQKAHGNMPLIQGRTTISVAPTTRPFPSFEDLNLYD